MKQSLAPTSEPEEPSSNTGSVTQQLCDTSQLLNLSAPWCPHLYMGLVIRRLSSASWGCCKDLVTPGKCSERLLGCSCCCSSSPLAHPAAWEVRVMASGSQRRKPTVAGWSALSEVLRQVQGGFAHAARLQGLWLSTSSAALRINCLCFTKSNRSPTSLF